MYGRRVTRLKDDWQDPRHWIFGMCHEEGRWDYNLARLEVVCEKLRAKQIECSECIDKSLTSVLLPVAVTQPRRVHGLLSDMLRALKVGASTVERAHLPAEETKPGKARGRALACENLAQVAYQSFVVADAQSLTAAVEGIELAKRGVTMNAYRKVLPAQATLPRSS